MNSAMTISISILVVMTCVGLFFGLVLAFANKKFAVEVNPLIHIVEDILPKGQCGACGYPGCMAYAEAVVTDPDVPPNLCTPGKAPVAKLVSELTGKKAADLEPRVAHVRCAGTASMVVNNYVYKGVQDCVAASLLLGGWKGCPYGCLGFGTCVKSCPFGAMVLSPEGLPIIDEKKCTGCGKCETVCPKKVIEMAPPDRHVQVNCNSHYRGMNAKKLCPVACIGCGLCAKECRFEAVKMENNLAYVDTNVCRVMCKNPTCLGKCPTGAIKWAIGEKPDAPAVDVPVVETVEA